MTQTTQEIRKWAQMSQDERLRYVADFGQFATDRMPRLVALGKQGGTWTPQDRQWMQDGLRLLGAWPFAEKFVQDALRYGDYSARTYRLPLYCDLAKKELQQTLTIQDADGRRVALVDPTVPQRRRGRPTREEMAARRRGELYVVPDTGAELPKRIAQMLGLDVIVTDRAPRELNNDELAVIRQQRQAEYDRQNPSLFQQPADDGTAAAPVTANNNIATPAGSQTSPAGDVVAGAAKEVNPAAAGAGGTADERPAVAGVAVSIPNTDAEDADYRLHLDQKAPFLSAGLQQRVREVRLQRQQFADASEKAKWLAEHGASQEEVADMAATAEQSRKAFKQTYAMVDEELAVLWYRLQNDEPFLAKFRQKYGYRGNMELNADLVYDLRRHYRKMESPEFTLRCRTLIEQESPEYMAEVKAREARDEEVRQILRYLKRIDKPNALTRRNTARQRFARLQELLGEKEASVYRPFLTKIEEDYDRNFRPADEAKAQAEQKAEAAKKAKAKAKEEKKKPSKQSSKQGSKKSSKEEKKQASKKTSKQEKKKEKK